MNMRIVFKQKNLRSKFKILYLPEYSSHKKKNTTDLYLMSCLKAKEGQSFVFSLIIAIFLFQ